jgi:hypothetical protein
VFEVSKVERVLPECYLGAKWLCKTETLTDRLRRPEAAFLLAVVMEDP